MTPVNAFLSLLQRAPLGSTIALLMLMSLTSLSEGLGILMLVPLLESLSGSGHSKIFFDRLPGMSGIDPSIGVVLAVFVAVVCLRAALVYGQQVHSSAYQGRMLDRLRIKGFTSLHDAEWRWLAARRSSDHAAVLIAGIGRIAAGLNKGLALIVSLFTFMACWVAAFLVSWQAASAVAVCAALAVFVLASHRRRALLLGAEMVRANRVLHAGFEAGLSGIRLAKIIDARNQLIGKIADSLAEMRRHQARWVAASARSRAALQVSSAVMLALIVYVATAWWEMSFAALIVLVVIFARIASLLSIMQQQYHHWLHALPALQEYEKLLTEARQAAEPEAAEETSLPFHCEESLSLHNVTFTYAGRQRPALENVSLTIARGTLTAVIGASGAGKSSLADLLMGLIVPDQGSFAADGHAITGQMRRGWRRAVGYVEQDAFFFDDTIRNNLLLAHPGASDEEIAGALQRASAQFVQALPASLDTVIGTRGLRLSGGERQRLALARALLGAPRILILDEATHALDPENEAAVWAAIERLRGTCTIIVLGHRLPILDQADQVIGLDHGRLIGTGSRAPRELAA